MTLKQKRVVGILATVNSIVILILAALITRPDAPPRASAPAPPPTRAKPLPPGDCQWVATQLLAQAGLGGTVTLTTDGSLDLKITPPLAPSQTADDAAQAVWEAFDIALALPEQECPPFTQVHVTILVRGDQSNTQINASVSASDLTAFDTNELSQDEFIERVTYTTGTMRNE